MTATVGAVLLRTRWFVRTPIPLYRAGLGWLFGSRILLLQHRGRHTGAARYVALECIMRPSPLTVYVASGFGLSSQWYRNLQADPQVRVSIGRIRSRPAVASLLTKHESEHELACYAERHGAELRHLVQTIAHAQADHRVDLRLVRLELHDH